MRIYRIRSARISDAEEIAGIIDSLQLVQGTDLSKGFLTTPADLELLRFRISDAQNRVLVAADAYDDSEPLAGFLTASILGVEGGEAFPYGTEVQEKIGLPRYLYVRQVGVRPEARGQNLGRFLWASIRNQATLLNLPLILAIVTQPLNRGSIEFHEKIGATRIPEALWKVSGLDVGIWQMPRSRASQE